MELERTDVNNERVDFVQIPQCLKSFVPLSPLGKGQQKFIPHMIDEASTVQEAYGSSKVTLHAVRRQISGLLSPTPVTLQLSLSLVSCFSISDASEYEGREHRNCQP